MIIGGIPSPTWNFEEIPRRNSLIDVVFAEQLN
jgi:hypothetical protein